MTPLLFASILLTGFALGIVHALDPDHVMTIASLSARSDTAGGKPDRGAALRYAALWSLGHGGLLVAIAAATFVLGWSMPAMLPAIAERSVGVILIAAGMAALWLRHPPHASTRSERAGLRERVPFAVGLVHGLAGSAAMLALVPIALYQPLAAVFYAVVFSAGVLAGMMLFALLLGRTQAAVARSAPRLDRLLRMALGIGAIGMGAFWLQAG